MKEKIFIILLVLSLSLFATRLNAQNYNQQAQQMGNALGKAMAAKIFGSQVLEGNVRGLFYKTDDGHLGFYAENVSNHTFDMTVHFSRPSINKNVKNKVQLTGKNNMEYHPQNFESDWIFKKGDVVTFSLANGMSASWTCPENDKYYTEQMKKTQQVIIVDDHQQVPQKQQCLGCYGSGKCSVCNGTGLQTYWVSSGQKSQRCGGCNGTGACGACGGRGHTY